MPSLDPTTHVYSSYHMTHSAPKQVIPDEPTLPRVAKQVIEDELALDGNPHLNMASFVTTYMEPEAEEIMLLGMKKNFIDMDEYGQTMEIHNRCVAMLSNLLHAPPPPQGRPHPGTATIGSSEAIMLAVLAMKWKWRDFRRKSGLSTDRPNIVCGSNIQICWQKACKYFDIECREAEVSPDTLVLTPQRAQPLIDENTIGVCCLLGSTFNGEYEDVKGIHDVVMELNASNGWKIPIHVDAASGGFVAPFITPELEWDFRLPGVKSINVSGHKYGMVYAGIGWALWREPDDLPEDLVFHVNYLGGDQANFTLNFSRGASNILAQYYNFIRLGKQGYKKIIEAGMMNAEYLRSKIREIGAFKIVDKGDIPLVAFALTDTRHFTVFDIQDQMRSAGWIVPAYTCPKGACDFEIMRIVVKQNFSCDTADMLIERLVAVLDYFRHISEGHQASEDVGRSATTKVPLNILNDRTLMLNRKKLMHSHSTKDHKRAHRQNRDRTDGVC